MTFKKKFLLLILFFIIVFHTLIYTNNNQKTSFRFFKWTVQEVSIGKLISISFFSGLFISTLLNTATTNYNKKSFQNIEENNESLNNDEEIISNVEMPPQRGIRDTQPTISVNYRVVKNMEEENLKRDQNSSNNNENSDDWDNDDNGW
tara:strand:- start:13 stop:456 length:444 start_codon:yes stop_codon:yes gene_type:complete